MGFLEAVEEVGVRLKAVAVLVQFREGVNVVLEIAVTAAAAVDNNYCST